MYAIDATRCEWVWARLGLVAAPWVKSLSALCCRVCNSVTRCARSVGSQVAQCCLGRVVRGNFDACVQRGRVCGRRSFTRGRGSGDFFRTPLAKALLPPSAFLSSLIPFVSRTYCSTNCDNRVFPTQSAFWLRCPLRGVRSPRRESRSSPRSKEEKRGDEGQLDRRQGAGPRRRRQPLGRGAHAHFPGR